MWELDNKKADCWRIDAFKLWCWRRRFRVPWTARRSNQSILKKSTLNIHWKYWCWSCSSDTLATWCKEPTLEKTPMLGKTEGKRRRGGSGWDGWMTSLTQRTWVWANSGRWCRTGKPAVLQLTESQRAGYDWVTEQQQVQGLLTLAVHWSYLGDLYIKISLSGSWVFPSAA